MKCKCGHKWWKKSVCVRVLFMLRIPRQEAVVLRIPPLSFGYQGDVSAGAKNIIHMCLFRNVCVFTGIWSLWKTHTHAMTQGQSSVCFVYITVFMCSPYTSVSLWSTCVDIRTQYTLVTTRHIFTLSPSLTIKSKQTVHLFIHSEVPLNDPPSLFHSQTREKSDI